LQTVLQTPLAFDNHGIIDVSFAEHGQQLDLFLVFQAVVLDGDVNFWADGADVQVDRYFVLIFIKLDPGIVERGRKITLRNQRLPDAIHIVAQKIARERSSGLKLKRRSDVGRVKASDLETAHMRLLAGRDRVYHYAASSRG